MLERVPKVVVILRTKFGGFSSPAGRPDQHHAVVCESWQDAKKFLDSPFINSDNVIERVVQIIDGDPKGEVSPDKWFFAPSTVSEYHAS